MSEFKGTPGPWEVIGPCCDGVGTERDGDWYKTICNRPSHTGGKLTDEFNANMYVIAAAPELLEALITVTNYLDATSQYDESQIIVDLANAVIAKALGKQS